MSQDNAMDGSYNAPPLSPVEETFDDERLLDAWSSMHNIVPEIDGSTLEKLARRVIHNYDVDLSSRSDWERRALNIEKAAKLEAAPRIWAGKEERNNIPDYTILSHCLKFQAQALPVVIPGKDVVKCEVVGEDPDGIKKERAERISVHMSDQLINRVDCWPEETDKMLLHLSMIGFAARKTYYCVATERVKSDLLTYHSIVVNNHARSFRDARCITHVIRLSKNEVVSRVRSGLFVVSDVDNLFGMSSDECDPNLEPEDSEVVFYEQHMWHDLDDDGYAEPLIVTVARDTREIVRICARWDDDGVILNDDNEVVHIEPVEYFTRFIMFHSPCGSIYGMGLGQILYPINCTRTTITNDLLDAAFSNNKPGGWLGRAIQLGRGESILKVEPGVYQSVANTGEDLRKNIVNAPVSPPDATLYKLWLDLAKEADKQAATQSLMETFPANTPATTVLAYLDESMKNFRAVFQRLFMAFKKEFAKIRRLNYLYLPVEEYNRVLDLPDEMLELIREDYNASDLDVEPVADLRSLVRVYKIFTARAILELRERGLNDPEIYKRYLEALDVSDIDGLLQSTGNEAEQAAQQIQAEKEQAETQLALAKRDREIAETERISSEIPLKNAQARKLETETADMQIKSEDDGRMKRAEMARSIMETKKGQPKNKSGMAIIPQRKMVGVGNE